MIRANRMRARFHAMFAWMCLIALTFGPVLLIRNSNGVWFAAGIPKLDDEDR